MALSRSLVRLTVGPGRPHGLPYGAEPLRILHHSPGIAVVQKPVGLVAQGGHDQAQAERKGDRQATLDQYLEELAQRLGLPSRVGGSTGEHGIRPMHRLDKDVEGPFVLALTATKAKELGRQFKAREIVKTYYALVSRYLPPAERPPVLPAGKELSQPVTTFVAVVNANRLSTGRVSAHPGPATVHQPVPEFGVIAKESTGAPPSTATKTVYEAQTAWAFLGGSQRLGLSLVRLHPVTGRKHQLRVFCADTLRAPIVGDELYGYKPTPPHLTAEGDGKARSKPRLGASPPGPTAETPLFLKCVSVRLTTLGPSGRPKAIVIRDADVPGADEAGWPNIRPWFDDWVGEPEGAVQSRSSIDAEAELGQAREARERQLVLDRRKRRREAKKGGKLAKPSDA